MDASRSAQDGNDGLQGAGIPSHSWSADIGPGLVTLASDNDASGIATYTLAGAWYGFDLLWVCVLSYPSTVALQLISARVAAITGRGLTRNMREHYAPIFFYFAVARFLFANAFNIAVDLLAMGVALRTLCGGSLGWLTALSAGGSLLLQWKVRYARYARVLKWLTVTLFAYAGVLIVAEVPWKLAALGSLVPHVSWSQHYVGMLVAVLGTTVSPYLLFAQAEQEVEETRHERRPRPSSASDFDRRMRKMRRDTLVRTLLSNACSLCILMAAATTLHFAIGTKPGDHVDMDWVLRPIANGHASVVLAFALIGTALLTLPPLAGSAAQAGASLLDWQRGAWKDRRTALVLVATMLVGTLAAIALSLWHVDLVRALYWSALVNGMTVTPVLILLVLLSTKREAIGDLSAHWSLRVLAWIAVVATGAALAAHTWLGLCQLVEIETELPQVRHSFRSRSADFGLHR